MAKAKIQAKVDLDGRGFQQGIAKAKAQTRGLGKSMGGLKKSIAAAFSVGVIGNFSRNLIALGSELSDNADQANLTTDEYQALEFAMIKAGGKGDTIVKAMSKMKQSVGAAETGLASYSDAFARLGINITEFASMTNTEQLEALSKANSATKDYDLSLILGAKNVVKLKEVMRDLARDGFQPMLDSARGAAEFIDAEMLVRLDALEDYIQRVKRALQGFGIGAFEFLGKLKDEFVFSFLGASQGKKGEELQQFKADAFATMATEKQHRIAGIERRVEDKQKAEEALRIQKRQLEEAEASRALDEKQVKAMENFIKNYKGTAF